VERGSRWCLVGVFVFFDEEVRERGWNGFIN
jgi:hypothetical protein